MVKVFSDFNDAIDAIQHYTIVRTSFLRNVFSTDNTTASIAVAEYWKEIDRFESTLIIEFEDKTVTYKNGVEID